MEQSIAIYRKTKNVTKEVEREAKVANKYIEDVECKFEHALFNAPKEVTYLEIYFHFLKLWERYMKQIQKKHKFKHIQVNVSHYENLYFPRQ